MAADIDAGLRARAAPERAERERAYLKSELVHYGTSVPDTRAVVTVVVAGLDAMGHDDLVAVAEALWVEPVHERRLAAVEVLTLGRRLLTGADLPLLERRLRASGTWALVDSLAATVVGAIVEREPSAADVLDRWATDPDMWIRRSALLALLVPLRTGAGDWERFARYADQMLDEREFFVRKAIGWVLRDTARRRPDLVHEWLLPRAARASGVTIREAVKPLSDAQRAEIAAAR